MRNERTFSDTQIHGRVIIDRSWQNAKTKDQEQQNRIIVKQFTKRIAKVLAK